MSFKYLIFLALTQCRATDPWRKNKNTVYPYVACTLQAIYTERGVQKTRRAGLELARSCICFV